MSDAMRYILGSRSPQRLALLRLIVPVERIDVVPPADAREQGFEGLDEWGAIRDRLLEIARGKLHQVRSQISPEWRASSTVITADTVIVAGRDSLAALGQPPDDDSWRECVRDWFHRHYLGRSHHVMTAVCVSLPDGVQREKVASTRVVMNSEMAGRVEWYLSTGEPRGKAGGYALQGAGSVFIQSVEGSLSNVVGLPLEALLDLLPPVAPA
jgi:septum formation protein